MLTKNKPVIKLNKFLEGFFMDPEELMGRDLNVWL
jgi:hypothetical protein